VSRQLLFVAVMIVSAVSSSMVDAEGIPAVSEIEAVTVYRGQALVTRKVTVPTETGELEIIVGDLPAQIIGPSLYVSAADGVTIRSVRYRTRAVAAAPKKEVAELDAKIKDLNRQIYANTQRLTALEAKGVYLDKLADFTASTAHLEMAGGVLNTQTLGELTEQMFERRTELTDERIELSQLHQELNEDLALLKRKRGELTRGAGKAVREAVIFLGKTADGPGQVRLSYLVGSANWSPAYNVRLGADGKAVNVEYLAQIYQMSGEAWPGVKLILSTATPQMNAESPLLAPLWVGLAKLPEGGGGGGPLFAGKMSPKQYAAGQASLRNQQRAENLRGTQSGQAASQLGWALNRLAAEAQNLELNVDKKAIRAGRMALRAMAEGLAVSYELPGRMSLASRSDRQLVQIAALKLFGEVHYRAIPLLSSYVYRQAEIVNTSALPLLAGPYSAYIGGEFVGKGRLPLVARGQEVTVGFGVDTQLRCRRELIDKSDKIVWGSRVQTFRYRLRLENYKDTPVALRLIDRVPATKTEDLTIELGRMTDPLSEEPLYVRDLRGRGILRWDILLAANAAASKARDVEYGFEMKFAKDKHIDRYTAGLLKEMEKDYNLMLQAK